MTAALPPQPASILPAGVTVDSTGNLYIADYCQSTASARWLPAAASSPPWPATVLQTFSGDGGAATAASLNQPFGVAMDSAGTCYIADTTNHRIRKVAAESGIITTVAGN